MINRREIKDSPIIKYMGGALEEEGGLVLLEANQASRVLVTGAVLLIPDMSYRLLTLVR